jgi:hypothetical protein
MFKLSPVILQTFINTRLTLTPSIIPNSNYVIMVSDRKYLKYFCVFLYQVHRDFLIILYISSNTKWELSPKNTAPTKKGNPTNPTSRIRLDDIF